MSAKRIGDDDPSCRRRATGFFTGVALLYPKCEEGTNSEERRVARGAESAGAGGFVPSLAVAHDAQDR